MSVPAEWRANIKKSELPVLASEAAKTASKSLVDGRAKRVIYICRQGYLSVRLCRKIFPTFRSTACNNFSTAFSRHSCSKSMIASSFN